MAYYRHVVVQPTHGDDASVHTQADDTTKSAFGEMSSSWLQQRLLCSRCAGCVEIAERFFILSFSLPAGNGSPIYVFSCAAAKNLHLARSKQEEQKPTAIKTRLGDSALMIFIFLGSELLGPPTKNQICCFFSSRLSGVSLGLSHGTCKSKKKKKSRYTARSSQSATSRAGPTSVHQQVLGRVTPRRQQLPHLPLCTYTLY